MNPQFFTTSGKVLAGALSPADFTGLIGWWKADSYTGSDGDLVASWNDSSGSGKTATQGNGSLKPKFYNNIYNGKPCMRFDGGNDYLTLASSLTPIAWNKAWSAIGVGKIAASKQCAFLGSSDSTDYLTRNSSANRIEIRILSSGAAKQSNAFTTGATDLTMFSWTIADGASGQTAYDAATSKGSISNYENVITLARIGNDGSNNFYPWDGDICEICFYRADMAPNLSNLYTNYFKPKWGLA